MSRPISPREGVAEREAILERDELRRANVTPEDAERPLGQSVEYWQDRCLDHATALDRARIERDRYRTALLHLMEFGKRLMASDYEVERGIGCCICEGARVVEGTPDA